MKKLTTSVLAVVLTSSFALVNAQSKRDSTKVQDIEGVVVTALGIKREKKSLGYASEEVKASELTGGTTNTGNIASQLSGKVAGLNVTTTNNFGGSSNLVIRGIKALGGGNPLIVIDGSPVNNTTTRLSAVDYGNALSDINQEDIESVNVLKGAAASALYGERGLNGVIVITTKNGRGKEDGSWGVTLSSGVTASFIDKSTFPEYQNKYGGGYEQDFYMENANADGNNYANFAEDASWGPAFNSSLLVYQWDAFDPSSPNYGKATPWVAAKNTPIDFFDTGITYINSITLQKGGKDKNVAFTYDNFQTTGIIPNSKLKKNNFSLKVNYDFTPKLHSSFYTTLTLQDTKGRNTTGYSDNLMSGFRQWWQTNVDLAAQRSAYFNNRGNDAYRYGNVTWNRNSSSNAAPAYWNNPYFQVYENYATDERTRSFSYANLTYDINDHINVMGKVSYDRTDLFIENRLAVGSIAQSFGRSGSDIASGYSRRNIKRDEMNFDLMANYKYDITDKINISGVVGGNVRRNSLNYIYASTEGGLVVPGIYALSNSAGTALAPYEDEWTTQTNSAYATVSVDFNKIFYLDGTFRVDESSTLPKGENVYKYPSITGSLILSELWKVNAINFWKVRANYAEVGGTADPYQLVNTYDPRGIADGVGVYTPNTSRKNPNLKPQRSKEYEFGTEIHVLKDRITFDAAYYNTRTFNQIISLPVSAGTGWNSVVANAGEIENKGFEFQLGLVPIKKADLTWNIDVNWSKNENKVVELYQDSQNFQLDSYQGGVTLNAYVGKAWGTLIGTDYQYDDNGNKVMYTYTSGGKTYARYTKVGGQVIGNATPDWIGGLRNSFTYKNFSLSFLIDVRHGGDVFSTDMYYGLATGLYKETAAGNLRTDGYVFDGVLADGTVNTYAARNPALYGSGEGYVIQPAKAFVYDGSYVKLREASISYMLPKSLIGGTFINEAKVSLVGRNLWIIHKNLPYADPEAMVGGANSAYGWSIGSTPTTRDIGVNVTFKF